jgi:hypothetical protein
MKEIYLIFKKLLLFFLLKINFLIYKKKHQIKINYYYSKFLKIK